MPNVVTPFLRRHHKTRSTTDAPRHRREGFFDEHDEWHDAETAKPQATRAHG
jgi:hypothetical protein